MTELYEDSHFTRDAAVVEFHEDADGITVDDGETSIDWSEVETVRLDNPPRANAFDSKEFYRIPATVARPIEQPYHYGEDELTLKKPREELKKAAWSLDNAPFTLGHPDTGMVKNVDDVHGFWQNPRYLDGVDDLDADLHIPVTDDAAKEHVESNGDVSVGFYNRVARIDEYDGVVGGEDAEDDDVDGYQTNMLFDHVAAVERGRCPSDEGCGLSTDSASHGHVNAVDGSAFKRGTGITHSSDEGGADSTSMEETTDAPSGIHVADGMWFAVGPDEHPDDSTEYADDAKFPVDSCADIEDALNLSGTGDISIDESTLESRIERAAAAKDCDLDTEASDSVDAAIESAKRYSVCGSRDVMDDEYYCDGDCGGDHSDTPNETDMSEDDTNDGIQFGLDDLSVDAALAKVEAEHDAVSERLDELRENQDKAEAADEAAEELDVEVDELADAVALKEQRIEELEEELDEVRRPQMEEDAEFIAEHTDRFGEDADEVMEELDEDASAISEKRELVEDLTEEYDERTANGDGGGDSSTKETTDGYAKTPW